MADYLNELKKYHPQWEFEFVEGDWSNLLLLLREKKIDLLCSARYSAARVGAYDEAAQKGGYCYSAKPIGQLQGLLYTNEANSDLYYNDYKKLATTTIGFLKGSLNIELFEQFMQTYYEPDYTIADKNTNSKYIKLYENETAMTTALEAGEIEALATENLSYHDDLRIIAKYGCVPFYFMSYYESDLMPEIDSALSAIKADNYYFKTELYQKYYATSAMHQSPLFTREEADYLKSNPQITVGFLPDRFPLSHLDRKTGELTGVNEDIAELIFEFCGISLQMTPLDFWEKTADALASGKCALVAGVIYENFDGNSDVVVSNPFMTSNLVVASKRGMAYDQTGKHTIAINKSFEFLQKYIAEKYPNFQILITDSVEASVQAVLDGKADVIMQNAYVLNYLLQNPRYDSLQIIPTEFLTEHSAIVGLNHDTNQLLISAVNKAIVALPQEKIDQIINANTIAQPYVANTSDFIYKYHACLHGMKVGVSSD
ncbi:MAG: transporter substrate-binding domain-containing protein [Clostridia bacterium]|nr:transporter substrate-binding domain-containing protein [Clostridia bacterium]